MEISSKTIKEIDKETEKENQRTIEAILFLAGKYLSISDFVSLTNLNPVIIKETLNKLKEIYDKRNSAIEIINKNNLWKMDIKKEYHYLINKIVTGESEFTKAEQETLAIIAYKQPIKQSTIIKIRGNKAYDHIKKFLELGLITKKKMGHTHEIKLSEEFYNYFNIPEVKSLKEIEQN